MWLNSIVIIEVVTTVTYAICNCDLECMPLRWQVWYWKGGYNTIFIKEILVLSWKHQICLGLLLNQEGDSILYCSFGLVCVYFVQFFYIQYTVYKLFLVLSWCMSVFILKYFWNTGSTCSRFYFCLCMNCDKLLICIYFTIKRSKSLYSCLISV